jgi:hypothetical protein
MVQGRELCAEAWRDSSEPPATAEKTTAASRHELSFVNGWGHAPFLQGSRKSIISHMVSAPSLGVSFLAAARLD